MKTQLSEKAALDSYVLTVVYNIRVGDSVLQPLAVVSSQGKRHFILISMRTSYEKLFVCLLLFYTA